MKKTPEIDDLHIPKAHELPDDVVPLFGHEQHDKPALTTTKILYDSLMMILLVADLLLILVDNVLMSTFVHKLAEWFDFHHLISSYAQHHHSMVAAIGGIFTAFWVIELMIRWVLAIVDHTYHRWFFFPFVHWYEVLACFPALRALRLLRLFFIIKRLHQTGIQIIPNRWLNSAKFYYHLALEELSDRVILTATDNFRSQMKRTNKHSLLVQKTLQNNRTAIENAILELLRHELSPKLQAYFVEGHSHQLSTHIGQAVERALVDTPELRKYLKLIPIAGNMIENQITDIGKRIGENVTEQVNAHLFNEETLDALMAHIARGIADIDINRPALQSLATTVIDDALTAFEEQVKIQQWKHGEQIKHASVEH